MSASRTFKTRIQFSFLLMLTLPGALPAGAQLMTANTSSFQSVRTLSPVSSAGTFNMQPVSSVSTSTPVLSPISSTPVAASMPTLTPMMPSIQPVFTSPVMMVPITQTLAPQTPTLSPVNTVNTFGTIAPTTSVISSPLANVSTLAPITPTFQMTTFTSSPTFTLSNTQTSSNVVSTFGNLQPLTLTSYQPKYNFNFSHILSLSGAVKGNVGNAVGGVVGTVGEAVGGAVGGAVGEVVGTVSGGRGNSSSVVGAILDIVAAGRSEVSGPSASQFAANSSLANVVSIVNAGAISSAQANMQLALFSSANQVLQGAKGQRITGSQGTMISHSKDMVILHRGALTVASGEMPTIIQTRLGELTLRSNTLAQIDDSGKQIRVSAVSGETDAVSLRGDVTRGQSVSANPGQDLIFAANGIEDEELICADGTVETVISGAIEKRATVARKTYSGVEQETISDAPARAGRHVRLGNAMPGSFRNEAGSTVSSLDARQKEMWQALEIADRDGAAAPLQIITLPGCQLEPAADGTLNLISGTVFLAPKNNAKLQTQFAEVEVKRNGLVMVEHVGGVSRIKALSGPGDVLVSASGTKVPLAPGQELFLADHAPSAVEVNPADAIARRVRSSNLAAGSLSMAVNDFSIGSMLHYAGYRQMVSSVDAKLFERVLKIAAVVELVGRGRGQYSYSPLYQQNQNPGLASQVDKISSADVK